MLLAPFGVLSSAFLDDAPEVEAAINEELHFQARLLTAGGSLVPDGNYNVQFHIYSGGDGDPGTADESLEWSGSYLKGNTQGIDVVNGYVPAQLGESGSSQVNTLADVDWGNGTLWLSINIGDSTSTSTTCTTEGDFNTNCGGDGEMGPFIRLGSTPYAFNAANLDGRGADEFVQLDPGGTSQAVNTANAVIDIDQAGAGALVNLEVASTPVFTIANNGNVTTSGDIAVNGGDLTTTSGTGNLFNTNATTLNIGGAATTLEVGSATGTTSINNALTVDGLTTASAGLTVTTGSTFTNASSSLFTAVAISDVSGGGDIGTAAATVDVATTFNVNQTTGSQTLTLDDPTNTTAGRIVYVNNVGSSSFTMYGSVIGAGQSNAFIWNGSSWVTTVSLSGSVVNTVGTIDSQTKSADGAVITANAIYLQTADATAPGLVSTGSQTIAGAKTFNNDLTLAADQSVILTGGTALPGSPTEGEIFYDNDDNVLYIYDGSEWDVLNGGVGDATVVVAATDSLNGEIADYIADGNTGAADDGDQVEINAAIDAVAAAGGGTVHLLEGTFLIDNSIDIDANVELIGSGDGTIIRLDDGVNPAGVFNLIGEDDNAVGWAVRHFLLDANDANNTGNHRGVVLGAVDGGTGNSAQNGAIIDDITFTDFGQYAVYIFDSNNVIVTNNTIADAQEGILIGGNSDRVTVSDNQIYSTTNRGIRFDGTAVNDATVTGNLINGASSEGIRLTGSNNTVTGNTISDSGDGIFLDGADNSTVSGNNISSSTEDGIQLNNGSDNNLVSGNNIDTTGTSDYGIHIADSDSNTIIGNNLLAPGAAVVYVDATSNDNLISGNTADEQVGTAQFFDILGDNTSIIGNQVYDTAGDTIGIDIDAGADGTYIADNVFNKAAGTDENIVDGGTNTVIANQLDISGNLELQATGSIELLSNTAITGTLSVSSLGAADTDTFLCRNTSNQVATCNSSPLTSSLTDNITDAFDLQEGSNNYININTTDASENISFGNATTNPSYSFLGSGELTVAGNVGIGTTSPTVALDVVGSTQLTNEANTVLTGSINPTASTSVTGVGTLFTTELEVGDAIVVNNETRTVIAIGSDTGLTVDRAFTNTPNDTSPEKVESSLAVINSSGALQFSSNADTLSVRKTSTSTVADNERAQSIVVTDTGIVTTGTDTTIGQNISVARTGATGGTINTYGLSVQATGDSAGAGSSTTYGISGQGIAGDIVIGVQGAATNISTDNVTRLDGVRGFAGGYFSTGDVTEANALVGLIQNAAGGGTITDAAGLRIETATNTATITNNYGIYVENQTAGGTDYGIYVEDAADYSLYLASTDGDAASGITFGGDTNLYRSAANTLLTDDNLTVSLDLTVNGNTTLGDANTDTLTINAGSSGSGITFADSSFQNCTLSTNGSGVLTCTSGTPLVSSLTDNVTDAFDLQEGSNNYININTTDSSENISFGNATTNPSYSFLGSGGLTVAGTLDVAGRGAFGNDATIGTTATNFLGDAIDGELSVEADITALIDQATSVGVFGRLEVNPDANPANNSTAAGLYGQTITNASNSTDASDYSQYGVFGESVAQGSGDLGTVSGVLGLSAGLSTGNIDYLYGGVFATSNFTSTVTTLAGIDVLALGSATTSIGGDIEVNSNGGTVSDAFGLRVDINDGGTIDDAAGIAIDEVEATDATNLLIGTTTIPNGADYSIYNASTRDNVFNGNLRVGSTTAPTVALDVTGAGIFSGDLTVSTDSSLILTGGTALPGSPVAGEIFYDSDDNAIYLYNGSQWEQLNGNSSATFVVAASDSINPELADYRADGTADEVTIQAAIDALPAGGGTVYLMEGTFVTDDSITLGQYDRVVGAGEGTVVQLAATRTADVNMFELVGDNYIGGLTLDGNESNQADTDDLVGVDIAGDNNVIEYVQFIDHERNAIALNTGADRNIISNSEFSGNGTLAAGTAILVGSNEDNIITDNVFESNDKVDIASLLTANIVISNNSFSQSGTYAISSVSTGVSITNNNIDTPTTGGIYLADFGGTDSSYAYVSGNYIRNSGGATTNNAIEVEESDYAQVTNNYIIDDSCTTSCYAINISSSDADETYLAGNTYVVSAGTDQPSINDSGTNTIFASQQVAGNNLQSGSAIVEAFSSSVLTGTTDPEVSTTLEGTGTVFTAELQVGDRITINAETRTVTSITDDDTLTVDTAFTDTGDTESATRLPAALAVRDSSSNTDLIVSDQGFVGIGTAAPTVELDVVGSGQFSADLTIQGNTTIGNANTDTLTINAGSSGSGITFADSSFQDCILTTNASGVLTCAGTSSGNAGTLQGSYDADADGSDATIALTSADDSLVISNPASSGTDSAYALRVEQLDTGGVAALQITSAGSSNIFEVFDDGTYTDTTPFVIDAGGNVGIGDATPDAKLDVEDTITDGEDGARVQISATGTGGGVNTGQYIELNAAPTGASTSTFRGQKIYVQSGSTNVDSASLYGQQIEVVHSVDDAVASITGLLVERANYSTSASSSIGTSRGVWIGNTYIPNANPTVLNDIGAQIGQVDQGTNNTTLYLSNTSNFFSAPTGDWALYSDIAQASYLEGGLRVGSTTDLSSQLSVEVADTENLAGITIDQNDTTNNPLGLNILNAGTGDSLQINSTDFIVDGAGNVGIGIDPTYQLDIFAASGSAVIALDAGGSWQALIEQDVSSNFRINTDNNERFTIAAGGNVGLGSTSPSQNLEFGEDADKTLGVEARSSAGVGRNLTVSAGTGNGTNAGGVLALQGGDSGASGNVNGGNVTLTGGQGNGTGTQGLVVVENLTFDTATTQTCGSNCTITQANLDATGAVIIDATSTGIEVIVPDPTITTSGRLIYVSADDNSEDFTLTLNDGTANEINISLRENETATLIWNGNDWTAAGASSSNTLQSAYNNTLTSAGGAEIVLNAPGGDADGFTIRNNGTTPINGGILEVQSAIGTNLFSVNNIATEYAANGGAEDDSTFATDWTDVGTTSSTRETGTVATGTGSVTYTANAINEGVRNNLATDLATSTQYMVSFTARTSSGTWDDGDVNVYYSRNGGGDVEACTNQSTADFVSTSWTKFTCTITTDSTSPTDADLIIRQTDGTTRTVFIDNLSITENSSSSVPDNVQIGGGQNGGPVTLFTLDRASAPPVANGDETYLGSMYYDTVTGRIQCYEADGWGACGSAPNNYVNLLPEYPGSVLNGTGVGTMTADFCSNESGVLQINHSGTGAPCGTAGEVYNYYQWTSPQATQQTYSIYITYQLPAEFGGFDSNNTVQLTARTDNTTNGVVTYEMFRNESGTISACGTETTVTSSVDTWQTVGINGDEATGCGFSDTSADNFIIFKINMKANSNANVYASTLQFTSIGQ